MLVWPSPEVPEPSDVSVIVAVPDLTPTVVVSKPTDSELESLDWAASKLILPAALRPAEAVAIEASNASENPSAASVFVSVSACDTTSLRWRLPNTTGSGRCADGAAKRNTAPVIDRFWLLVLPKLLRI